VFDPSEEAKHKKEKGAYFQERIKKLRILEEKGSNGQLSSDEQVLMDSLVIEVQKEQSKFDRFPKNKNREVSLVVETAKQFKV
jgi:hypothetical protein